MKKFYDNTSLSAYKDCPRKYQLRHVLNWRSEGTAMPLAFGLSWHTAMDAVWENAKRVDQDTLFEMAYLKFLESWEEQGLPTSLTIEQVDQMSPRIPPVAAEMIRGYIRDRWSLLQSADLIASEQPFAVPIPGLEDRWYVGRLDKVINRGEIVALEHKSTTEYKKDGGFKTSYIEGWYSDSQVKGYEFGGGLFFPGLTQVWVDAALVHKTVHDKFRFVPVAHQRPLLEEWIGDTKEWISRVEKDTASGYFPKNENSCNGKFGQCAFLDVCRTTPDPTKLSEPPAGFVVDKWEPFELLGLNKIIDKEKTDA